VDRFVVGRVTGMDSDEETQAAVAALRQKALLEEYGGLVRLTDGWAEYRRLAAAPPRRFAAQPAALVLVGVGIHEVQAAWRRVRHGVELVGRDGLKRVPRHASSDGLRKLVKPLATLPN
jgi:hypothetical protein